MSSFQSLPNGFPPAPAAAATQSTPGHQFAQPPPTKAAEAPNYAQQHLPPTPQQPFAGGQAYANGFGSSSNLSPARTASPAIAQKFGPPPTAGQPFVQPNLHQNPQQHQNQRQQPPPQRSSQASFAPPQPAPNAAYNHPPQHAQFQPQPLRPPPTSAGGVQQLAAGMQNVQLTNGVAPTAAHNGNYAPSGQFNGHHAPPTNRPQQQQQPFAAGPQQHQHQQQQPFAAVPPPQQQQQFPPPMPNNNTAYAPPPATGGQNGPAKPLPKRPTYPAGPPTSGQYGAAPQQQPQYAPPAAFNGQPMSAAAASAPLQYQQQFNSFAAPAGQQQPYGSGSTVQHGFNKLWGQENVDLLQVRHILPATRVKPPPIEFGNEFYESINCSPDVLRCTLNKIPETNNLLQKSRLPLGILIHPFRDLSNLAVVQSSVIVRCRSCRTYINPFVSFVDNKKWRCNLCYRVNDLPDEFQYDPTTKSYGDVTRRPEVKTSTIEFIAPSEYMLRPPQPAIYLFLIDVSQIAIQSGYLDVLCASLSENLDKFPGDARTQVGFVAYNSAVHFYSIAEGFNQPHEITVVDIDDPFLPCPDNLLVNLGQCKELIRDLLQQLPVRFANSYDTNSALGSALKVAYKMMQASGGRVTVFQTCLPNAGPGALKPRENPNERSAKDIQNLGPAIDFYKSLALECSGQQIAVDLFLMNSQYSDLATLSGISKFSGGCMHHFPLFNRTNKPQQVQLFQRTLERYISRKIGFESVMRVRCTRGLNIHTFHGNSFVRSTDLLSLPNINPDAGFGMQITYDESLTDTKTVCFQAALLYTSCKGTRRIRVHTLCLPVSNSLSDVMHGADQQAIIGLIAKMAVDRSLASSIGDARDAFVNASVDVFGAYRLAQNLPSGSSVGQIVAPKNLALLPLYMMALLKSVAFRTGTSTRLDDRVFAMCQLKTLPLDQLIRTIYPDFCALDELFYRAAQAANAPKANGTPRRADGGSEDGDADDDEELAFVPALLQLSAEKLDSRSVFLLDNGLNILIMVGSNVPQQTLEAVFGVSHANQIPDVCLSLPELDTPENEALHQYIMCTSIDKPIQSTIQIIRDSSPARSLFIEHLIDDRTDSSTSYYEFLQHLRTLVK